MPFFSIIIPTYRRPLQLAASLAAIARLDYPRARFEVLIVDDGSDAPPRSAVEAASARINIELICAPHAGAGAARNAGAKSARGEFLAFTDDDCMPHPEWLSAFAVQLKKQPEQIVGGRTINALERNPFSATSQLLTDYLYDYYHSRRINGAFFATNNLALSSEGFGAMGGFDERFTGTGGEDRELCDRWRARGGKLFYEPKAVVRHAHDLSFSSFCRQHFRYGRGAHHYARARALNQEESVKIEPVSFYTGMLRRPFKSQRGLSALCGTTLLAVSQAANAAGYFYERLQSHARKNKDASETLST